jgi:formylglycine-generating enzyme required for sulfatase activity
VAPAGLALLALALAAGPACVAPARARLGGAGTGEGRLAPAGIELVLVRGGCFRMGAEYEDCDAQPDERPAHLVCVDDFYLGRYEVTRAQWAAVMGRDALGPSSCEAADCPIDGISFDEVRAFLDRLGPGPDGTAYRLPTEAEWEFAARSGGRPERYAGGDEAGRVAWYRENSGQANHPVGTKAPNGLGLHDMSGNVWEMTGDRYAVDAYAAAPRDNPTGPATGADRVVRGGSRAEALSSQRTTKRSTIGDRTKGAGRGGNLGFRIALPRGPAGPG